MSVSNGQLANATTFNDGFMDKNTSQTSTIAKVDLDNTDTASGSSVVNVQREINSLGSFTGRAPGSAKDVKPTWSNNDVGTSTDDLQDRSEALTVKFNPTSGHKHTGSAGDAPQISITDVTHINQYRADWQTFDFASASGTSIDVTSALTGKTSGGGTSAAGVITGAPNNRVVLLEQATQTAIEDSVGNRAYGRITFSGSTWTLSFYYLNAGVESAFTLPSQNIRIYFREVFTLANFPTIPADMGQIPSLDLTADVVDATDTIAGKVSIAAQSFGGDKTFVDDINGLSDWNGDIQTDSVTTGGPVTLPLPAKLFYSVTDSSLTDIDGITATSEKRFFMLINDTGNDVNILDQANSLPTDIKTGIGMTFILKAGQAILFIRNTSTSFWHMVGGGSELQVGALDGVSPSANGANIVNGFLYMQSAAAFVGPGLLTQSSQTTNGIKTWNQEQIMSTFISFTAINIATTGTNATITATTANIRLTSGSLVSIQTLNTPTTAKLLIIQNRTGNAIGVNSGGNISLGQASNITLVNNASLMLIYDLTSSLWQVVGHQFLVTAGAFGSTPNANGLSVSGQAISLQPADASNPGAISTGSQTLPGAKTMAAAFTLSNIFNLTRADDSSTTGANATLATPTTTQVKVTNASLISIDGITAPSTALEFKLTNGTGAPISINNDTGATTANRILTGTAATMILAIDASVIVIYDLGTAKWRIVGGSGGGTASISSGGTGGDWIPREGSAPIEAYENNQKIWLFNSGVVQNMDLFVRVPKTYVAGVQILMYIGIYSPSTLNTIQMRTLATLIRTGTDAIDDTTNTRTSINSALTNSSPANKLRETILDLTSTSGQINGVSVSAGDIIKIILQRPGDTDTADLRFIPNSTEVRFA